MKQVFSTGGARENGGQPDVFRATPYTVLIGLAGSFLAGAFLAAVIVPLYNTCFFLRDRLEERGAVIHGDRLRYF